MKKVFLSTILFIACATMSFGQEKTMEDRATKEMEKINANILSADPSAALSESQKKEIFNLYLTKFKDMNALKESEQDEDKINQRKKEINLKCNQTIYREVFTPEQRIANKEGREKNKK